MIITQNDLAFLSGKEFSNSYKFKLANNPLYCRTDMIISICKGKKVLHVGCCDHLPLINAKIEQNIWLQKLLDEHCSYVTGVDINRKAVDYVNRNKLAKNEVLCEDITDKSFADRFSVKEYDYVVLGEIVEHIDNPVSWLKSVKDNFSENGFCGSYLVSVPNAFSFFNSEYARKGIEGINSDHKYWFTPYTISKVMFEAGIVPEELFFVSGGMGGNGVNRFTKIFFYYLEVFRKKPSTYKSYRGDQIIIVGR